MDPRATSPPWKRGGGSGGYDQRNGNSRGGRVIPNPNPYPPAHGGHSTYNPPDQIPRKRPAPSEAQEAEWVAGEDRFVLQQAKKKAEMRVKDGRGRPIDWLAVTLRFVESSRAGFDESVPDSDLDVVDPEGVFEGLNDEQLRQLAKDIQGYVTLEMNDFSRDFWNTMAVICEDRREKKEDRVAGRGVDIVAEDIDRLLQKKSLEQLNGMERQVKAKLRSDEPIDTDYWEHLLQSINSWKAKAKLRNVSKTIIENQLNGLRVLQEQDAQRLKDKLAPLLAVSKKSGGHDGKKQEPPREEDSGELDPESSLKIAEEDKHLEVHDEAVVLGRIAADRRKILKLGYVPLKRIQNDKATDHGPSSPTTETTKSSANKGAPANRNEDFSQATTALYEREVARGVGENEEIFAGEEEISSTDKKQWSSKYRPRKPRYFNRVQMGYEWNKYNQTHYDHDNPPPKVVQGYKFNIFYPDLIDKTKSPTYKIIREHGRKRGQSFAAAGEEDTCLIRFISGPPYEDIAFRIVDKEWDYSAKRERGFKSTFEKGILQLHFQFKKIFYRK